MSAGQIASDPKSVVSNVSITQDSSTHMTFVAEPLEKGFGSTLGNAMRRVLLSSIRGFAVVGFYSDGVLHEFSTIPGVLEDVVKILMNLKTMSIKMDSEEKKIIVIDTSKEGAITGADIQTVSGVEIIDPSHYICTLQKGSHVRMELTVAGGVGYVPSERLPRGSDSVVGYIAVDALFNPVKRVSYRVDPARFGNVIDYEKLTIELESNGSMTPEDALTLGAQILQEQLQMFVFSDITMIQPKKPEKIKQSSVMRDLCRKVDELELSVRASNCLRNVDIKYVGDIISKTEQEILSCHNFGKKSLEEIKRVLARYGLTVGMDVPEWPPENVEEISRKIGNVP